MKGPPVNGQGTRFTPPSEWLFGKGFHGPPDDRPYKYTTRERARAWGIITHKYYENGYRYE